MAEKILLSVEELHGILGTPGCLVIDCRFYLEEPDEGYQEYLESHIPGAVYANLDDDLSSPAYTGDGGRHPLPDPEKFAAFLARSGWRPGKLLVAYDDAGGAIASRLWWLMQYFGQDNTALLDGGIPAWWAAKFETESGPFTPSSQAVTNLTPIDGLTVSTAEILKKFGNDDVVIADARAPERFTGRIEPIDTVAGHIPGAVSYPYNLNLERDGRFKTLQEVRDGLLTLTADPGRQQVVQMCGSGVTACHNIFAAELTGLEVPRLYVGSWSEWIRDTSRPIETSV